MNTIVTLKPIKFYEDRLLALRKQEQSMVNPLLKDWFAIMNQIRRLERQIRSMKNVVQG